MKFEDKVKSLREKKYKGRETKEFLEDVVKMAQGEPLEYLLGEVIFCGARIDLSYRPMIPRPEAEYWVGQLIQEQIIENNVAHELPKAIRVLDLFSGSGCIGIALLRNILGSTCDFIEYNSTLLPQIKLSLTKNNIEQNRASVITGDIWEGATGMYDIITAVPPYVPPHMKDEVMQELGREDASYFFDKEDGYYYHKQVLARAKEFLKEGGALYLEFDITQRNYIEQLAQQNNWSNYSFLKDPYGHECVIVLAK
jgi:release factor glutamine methyltransferase